ncbi:MAG: hypothetical protein ACK48R_19430 [Planctomyces sp.]
MGAAPLMQALDADQDGSLSPAEIENAAKALAKLDKNGDGTLSTDELRPAQGGPGDAGRPPRCSRATRAGGWSDDRRNAHPHVRNSRCR